MGLYHMMFLCFSERTSRDTVPLLPSCGHTTKSNRRPSVEASVEMCVLATVNENDVDFEPITNMMVCDVSMQV